MHARVVSFTGAKDVDGGVTYLRERVLPLLREQDGFRGVIASADRDNGVFAVLSLWESAAALDASDSALASTRSEAAEIMGGEPKVETFEQLAAEVGQPPPAPGSSLMVIPVSMDPAKIDDNIAFFKSDVAPRIKASPGFQGLRNLINRDTGNGMVGMAWADRGSMERAAEEAKSRREEAVARGVRFGETSFREIVLADLT